MKQTEEFEEFSSNRKDVHNDHVTKIINVKDNLFVICYRDFCFDLVDMGEFDDEEGSQDGLQEGEGQIVEEKESKNKYSAIKSHKVWK